MVSSSGQVESTKSGGEIRGTRRTSKVECDPKRRAELVVPCVTLPNTGIAVVHASRDSRLTEFCRCSRLKRPLAWLRYVEGVIETYGDDSQTSRTSGTKSSLALNGTMSTLVGATTGGRESTWNEYQRQGSVGGSRERTPRSMSCSRAQKLCSSSAYRMRPRPNEGSMTFGVYSRTRGGHATNEDKRARRRM